MGILEKIKFGWDSIGMIESLVKKWKPKDCKTEKSYEKSLYDFLHKNLYDIQVTKQYARGRIRADLVVGDSVIIEIKNNLDSTSKYQRLIGQLQEYKEWDGDIIILLIGETDKNLLKQLNKYIEQEGFDEGMYGQSVTIIKK